MNRHTALDYAGYRVALTADYQNHTGMISLVCAEHIEFTHDAGTTVNLPLSRITFCQRITS